MKCSVLIRVLLVLFVFGFTASCSSDGPEAYTAPSENPPPDPGDGDGGGGGDGGGTPVVPPPVSASVPLALKMSIEFDGTGYEIPLVFTETGTTTCEATSSNPVVTCSLVIPEGRLFFSKLNFAYSWLPNNCRLMEFQPYIYRASSDPGYFPPSSGPGDTGLDCGVPDGLEPAGCYGGVGVFMIPSFPLYKSLIYLPHEADLTIPQKALLTAPSAYEVKAGSNRHTANDLLLAKRGADIDPADMSVHPQYSGFSNGYVANTFKGYQFSCRDSWYDPQAYIINLEITDEDTSGVGPNDFHTWREAP